MVAAFTLREEPLITVTLPSGEGISAIIIRAAPLRRHRENRDARQSASLCQQRHAIMAFLPVIKHVVAELATSSSGNISS